MRFIRAASRSGLESPTDRAPAHCGKQIPSVSTSTRPTSSWRAFPKSRAELFQYRAIVLGSIEASFFTHDQLAMLADFVNVRGGGLLMLGGRRSFAEGGYAGTPLAQVMPVVISGDAVPDSLTLFADLKVALTPPGASHAVAQVAATPAAVGRAAGRSCRRSRASIELKKSNRER